MVELTIKAYSYDELYPNERENADYDIENLVCEVYDYNVKLLKEKHIGKSAKAITDLKDRCAMLSTSIAEQLANLNTGTVTSRRVSELLHNVVEKEIAEETLEEIQTKINSFDEKGTYQMLHDKFLWEEVASKYCERNGIYFTGNGNALFNGKYDYKIILE